MTHLIVTQQRNAQFCIQHHHSVIKLQTVNNMQMWAAAFRAAIKLLIKWYAKNKLKPLYHLTCVVGYNDVV